jgi:hypothetical protein
MYKILLTHRYQKEKMEQPQESLLGELTRLGLDPESVRLIQDYALDMEFVLVRKLPFGVTLRNAYHSGRFYFVTQYVGDLHCESFDSAPIISGLTVVVPLHIEILGPNEIVVSSTNTEWLMVQNGKTVVPRSNGRRRHRSTFAVCRSLGQIFVLYPELREIYVYIDPAEDPVRFSLPDEEISACTTLSVSPDGTKLYYFNEKRDIVEYDMNSFRSRRLGTHYCNFMVDNRGLIYTYGRGDETIRVYSPHDLVEVACYSKPGAKLDMPQLMFDSATNEVFVVLKGKHELYRLEAPNISRTFCVSGDVSIPKSTPKAMTLLNEIAALLHKQLGEGSVSIRHLVRCNEFMYLVTSSVVKRLRGYPGSYGNPETLPIPVPINGLVCDASGVLYTIHPAITKRVLTWHDNGTRRGPDHTVDTRTNKELVRLIHSELSGKTHVVDSGGVLYTIQ